MDTKTKYLCIIICPKKFKFAHNVFEVTELPAELCRTRADILKPTLDRTLLSSQNTIKYKQNLQYSSFGVDMWEEKELIFI